jgi:putative NADH-flavin reductase
MQEHEQEVPIIFGATGRVGSAAIRIALERGLDVIAVARNPQKLTITHERLHVITGDTLNPESVTATLEQARSLGATAVVMVVGANPLKASTVVTKTVRNITEGMPQVDLTRYLGISGTAQMPATRLGRVSQAAIRLFIQAARDHQGAYDILTSTTLDYVLAGCPYIKDGPATGSWIEEPGRFPGGFKTITPPDVADFLITELTRHRYTRQIVGIWR